MYRLSVLVVLFLLLLVGGAVALSGGVSRTSAGCNPNRGYDGNTYVAGAYRSPGYQVGGVYSSVWNYPDPYLETLGYSEQYVGVRFSTNLKAWIGWREWKNPDLTIVRYTYMYWKASSSTSGTFFTRPAQPEWNYTYYTVLHNRLNPGTLTFQVAGSTVKTVSNILWIPNRGDAYGESFSLGSQMPGDPNNVSDMNDTRIWYNGSWQSFSGNFVYTAPYHYAYGGGTSVTVEDLGCSS